MTKTKTKNKLPDTVPALQLELKKMQEQLNNTRAQLKNAKLYDGKRSMELLVKLADHFGVNEPLFDMKPDEAVNYFDSVVKKKYKVTSTQNQESAQQSQQQQSQQEQSRQNQQPQQQMQQNSQQNSKQNKQRNNQQNNQPNKHQNQQR